MDVFCEQIVEKKKTTKELIINFALIFAAFFLSMIIFMVWGVLFGLEVPVLCGIWYGAVYLMRKTNIEYEYILTNSILDIDKITAKRARKRVISIDFKNIEECTRENNINDVPGVHTINCVGNPSYGGVYRVDFQNENGKMRVYFQPNSRILNGLKNENPRLVNVCEDDLK